MAPVADLPVSDNGVCQFFLSGNAHFAAVIARRNLSLDGLKSLHIDPCDIQATCSRVLRGTFMGDIWLTYFQDLLESVKAEAEMPVLLAG